MLTDESNIANQKLSALRDLWDRKRGGRAMPYRADLTVADLRPWLGNLALIDVNAGGETFRLCGTNLFARFGGDVTGKRLRDLRHSGVSALRDCIAQVIKANCIGSTNHTQIINGEETSFDELALPLSNDGGEMSVVLVASYPAKTKPAW
jgi:hypothetical protein